ncbi:MAG TPA: formyltransferase family protein [Pyrinomonadaceae bacterium]|jgi:methionyl-tRNA formyltransferase|nr:formyltransferase family protein [Pyrinomonadaceae bacterium]
MRIGILAHSFSSAFAIYKAVEDTPGQEVFIILSPSPHRSARISHLANLARLVLNSLKGLDLKPLQLFATGRLIFLGGPFHDQESVDTLKKLRFDVGLHKAGVIYRDVTIEAFRLGILNHHIGILPAYRGRSVLEWSILQGDAVGITVFFIDTGIDTGARILLSQEIDISDFNSVTEAKEYLFNLDQVFFRKALALLTDSKQSFQLNDGTGPRYFVMSKLFQGVVDRMLQANGVELMAHETTAVAEQL